VIAVVADGDRWFSLRRFGDCLVVAALLSFVVFAWYWNLVPPLGEF
jgi:hypothetical protein